MGAIIAWNIVGKYAVKATNVKIRATSKVFCAKLTFRTEMILKACRNPLLGPSSH